MKEELEEFCNNGLVYLVDDNLIDISVSELVDNNIINSNIYYPININLEFTDINEIKDDLETFLIFLYSKYITRHDINILYLDKNRHCIKISIDMINHHTIDYMKLDLHQLKLLFTEIKNIKTVTNFPKDRVFRLSIPIERKRP